jgi:TolB-like protein/class 3 adenylate cyclase
MAATTATRRLAAIFAADVVGYLRLMGVDEEGTHERLKAHLEELINPKIGECRGRIVKNSGDGFLAEFASVVDAIRCAVEVQRGMAEREPEVPDERRIRFRIGINLGDVIAEGHDLFGDGLNVAARLEALAEPSGICVSRVVRDQVRDKLDYPFQDMGEQQVKNITWPLRVYRVGWAPASSQPINAPATLPLPDKPSIAVLPFHNMRGDPEQEYFADGMVEEITTALSRIRWLFVIARNSSFTYKGQSVDVKQVGRELGVHYVLEGSVRKADARVRITAQLIDAISGTHLWADRFDGSLEDIFELQDKVASSVAGVIEPALQSAEAARSSGRPTTDLAAYDLYLGAFALVAPSNRQAPDALRLLEQAIVHDPHYGPALALAAVCCSVVISDGRSEDRDVGNAKGLDFARGALEVAGDDPGVLVNIASSSSYFGEDIGAMTALVDRALALNPSFARAWRISGTLRVWAGQPDLATKHLETARRLNPRARVGGLSENIGIAHFCSRRFDQASPMLLLAVHDDPSQAGRYRFLAACYAHMGLLDEARKTVNRLRVMTAALMPPVDSFLRNAEHRELFLSGLRLTVGDTT